MTEVYFGQKIKTAIQTVWKARAPSMISNLKKGTADRHI